MGRFFFLSGNVSRRASFRFSRMNSPRSISCARAGGTPNGARYSSTGGGAGSSIGGSPRELRRFWIADESGEAAPLATPGFGRAADALASPRGEASWSTHRLRVASCGPGASGIAKASSPTRPRHLSTKRAKAKR